MNTSPEKSLPLPRPMERREAIKWMLTAAASTSVLGGSNGFAAESKAGAAPSSGKGYGSDPDLLKDYKPGDGWPLTLNETQRQNAAALCDVIIPADAKGPSASAVRVHEFIDEWVSAPYPGHEADKMLIV